VTLRLCFNLRRLCVTCAVSRTLMFEQSCKHVLALGRRVDLARLPCAST
jgi:hypothetical protein